MGEKGELLLRKVDWSESLDAQLQSQSRYTSLQVLGAQPEISVEHPGSFQYERHGRIC